jgi:hypothetical protein
MREIRLNLRVIPFNVHQSSVTHEVHLEVYVWTGLWNVYIFPLLQIVRNNQDA